MLMFNILAKFVAKINLSQKEKHLRNKSKVLSDFAEISFEQSAQMRGWLLPFGEYLLSF